MKGNVSDVSDVNFDTSTSMAEVIMPLVDGFLCHYVDKWQLWWRVKCHLTDCSKACQMSLY